MKNVYFIAGLMALLLMGCRQQQEDEPSVESLRGGNELVIRATIGEGQTRASDSENPYYIGRSLFVENDVMVLTQMKRTNHAIANFTYKDLTYKINASEAWLRQNVEGNDKIYWSDNSEPHTFIGYSVPQGWGREKWKATGNSGIDHFEGSFTVSSEDMVDFSTQDKIKAEDLLLTFDTNKQADTGGSVATLHYHHALSSVQVVVNIQEYASADNVIDATAKVTDMQMLNQPVQYQWKQLAAEVIQKDNSDKKSIQMWNQYPDGQNSGRRKTFTFVSLVVPGTQSEVKFRFKVNYAGDEVKTYEAPLTNVTFQAGYTTSIKITLNHRDELITVGAEYLDWENVATPDEGELQKNSYFLTHADRSKVTILGDANANRDDATWLYIDKTDLTKPVIRDIYGNPGTLAEPFVIKSAEQFLSFAYEVNGNDRKTFTYWTNERRDDENSQTVGSVSRTVAEGGGFDFQDYYISLESGLFLQPSMKEVSVSWPGIGVHDAENVNNNRPFNGRFMGGVRILKRLKGNPLFCNIGPLGHIDQLLLEDVISVNGNAAYVEWNEGVICAGKVGSLSAENKPIELSGNNVYNGGTEKGPQAVYVGAFCAQNNGALIACHSTARIRATGTNAEYPTRVGGLVGLNNGAVVCCYAAGSVESTATNSTIFGVIAGSGGITYKTSEGDKQHEGYMVFSVFDREVNPAPTLTDDGQGTSMSFTDGMGTYAVTTGFIQRPDVVGERVTSEEQTPQDYTLNGELEKWIRDDEHWPPYLLYVYNNIGVHNTKIIQKHLRERYYIYYVSNYPWVY